MSELKGIISTKGNLKSTINSKVKTNGAVSVGGTLITSNLSKKGDDGFSPIATVTKVGDTATITITDKNGTTTAQIHDGSGGGGATAFVAEYNVTSYADTKDAYDDDAIIICTADDSGNTAIYQLAYFDASNEIFYFTLDVSDGVWLTSLSNAEGWDSDAWNFASTDVATTLADGLMSALDKQKLDGIASGAEANVQSNWSQSDNTKDDYIKNKPTIPSKTSDLSNDSGFITSSSLPSNLSDLNNDMDVSDFPNDAGYITSAHEIPSGGTTGQVLTKDSGTDYDVSWTTVSGGGSVNDVTVDGTSVVTSGVAEIDLTGKLDIEHNNNTIQWLSYPDADALRTDIVAGNNGESIYESLTSGGAYLGYNDGYGAEHEVQILPNTGIKFINSGKTISVPNTVSGTLALTSDIPTNVSDLNNDSGFITTETDPTVPSWAKQSAKPSYTFSEIGSKPSTISGYGITDAKISSGTITLGSDSITPLTSFTETDPVFTASAAHGISSTDISNWNGKSDFSGSYNDLTDKPTIPTVNNATLTIQKNGTTVNTFTANASSNVTANITVHDVPSGGSANQVLAKNSGTDYDLKWTSAGGGGGTLVQLVRW